MTLQGAVAARVPQSARTRLLDVLHRFRWRTRTPTRRVTERFVAQNGLVIQAGPFAGMRFPQFAVGRGEMLVPQLLGAYEQELHPALTEVIGSDFAQIVDVGASDGYYAVGLARSCPGASVVAYEVNPFPARVCEALARENGVWERVDLRGLCTVESLATLAPRGKTFVLCDCEGGEQELMNPESVPWLRAAMLIVELHEFAAPGVQELLTRRFTATHHVEYIPSAARYAGDYDALQQVRGVNYMDRELGVSEFRPVRISWMVLRPR